MTTILIQIMGVMTVQPWIAFAVAGLLGIAWKYSNSKVALGVGITWTLYGLYELLWFFEIICSECVNPIRIVLLGIYPLLAIALILALIHSLVLYARKRKIKQEYSGSE